MRARSGAALAVLLALAAASGCALVPRAEWRDPGPGWGASGWSYGGMALGSRWGAAPAPAPPPRPVLPASASLGTASAAGAAEQRAALQARAPQGQADASAAARWVSDCFEQGQRDLAAPLLAAHPAVRPWDALDGAATVDCVYEEEPYGHGAVTLTVTRGRAVGPLAVCFPPGTYLTYDEAADLLARDGRWTRPEDDGRWGGWPSPRIPQDLGLLRAPVLFLAPGVDVRTVQVPVACASFRRGAPVSGQTYRLQRAAPGSAFDLLLQGLCARPRISEPAAQLAVWIARDDLSWEDFLAAGGANSHLATFWQRTEIRPEHALPAAQLLQSSGLDPRQASFFGGSGLRAPGDPEPEPEPAPPPSAGGPAT